MKEHLEIIKEELKNNSAILADVREKNEWDAGHIKEAEFVPLSSLKSGIFPDLDKSKKLYVYCRSGNRVYPAAELLKAMDYSQTIPLSEGFLELVEHGFEKE